MFSNTVEVHVSTYFSACFNSSAMEHVSRSLIFGIIVKCTSKMYVTFSLLIPSILIVDQMCLSHLPSILISVLSISLFTQSRMSRHYVILVSNSIGAFSHKNSIKVNRGVDVSAYEKIISSFI